MATRVVAALSICGTLPFACVEREGACETRQTFVEAGETHHRCAEDHRASRCQDDYLDVNFAGQPFTIVDSFHPDATCAEVGYPHDCGYFQLANPACDESQGPVAGPEGSTVPLAGRGSPPG